MPDSYKIMDGKKYLWDGATYATEAEANETAEKYSNDEFETKVIGEDGEYLVYTRREVTEVVVEGAPI